MDIKDIKEALAKAKKERAQPDPLNISLKIGYREFIFPYKEGISILSLFENAIVLEDNYSTPPKYSPISENDVVISFISNSKLDQYKAAILLNMPIRDYLEAVEKQNKIDTESTF